MDVDCPHLVQNFGYSPKGLRWAHAQRRTCAFCEIECVIATVGLQEITKLHSLLPWPSQGPDLV